MKQTRNYHMLDEFDELYSCKSSPQLETVAAGVVNEKAAAAPEQLLAVSL
jgi:hypothetical protein